MRLSVFIYQTFYSVKVSRIVHLRMAESFTLVVNYKGKEYQLNSELRVFGYTHKIAINIEGEEILFEPFKYFFKRSVYLEVMKYVCHLFFHLLVKRLSALFLS